MFPNRIFPGDTNGAEDCLKQIIEEVQLGIVWEVQGLTFNFTSILRDILKIAMEFREMEFPATQPPTP